MGKKPVRRTTLALTIIGLLLAAVAVSVLASFIEDETGQTWPRWLLQGALTCLTVIALLFLLARGAATVGEGEKAWLASVPLSSGTSFLSRIPMLGGKLVLDADAVTFKPETRIGHVRRYPLDSITEVEAFAERPPRLRIHLRDRGSAVLAIAPLGRPTWRSPGPAARDEAVREISSRLDTLRRSR